MDRRLALKNLTLGIGYAVAAPTVFNLLSSCTEKTASWKPLFFSEEEKFMVTQIVDIILPKSDVVGALEVNVPQFMDLMYFEVEKEPNKKIVQKGASLFQEKFENTFNKSILKGRKEEFEQIFKTFFNLSVEESSRILKEQKQKEKAISQDRKPQYLMYKFLFSIRHYTIFGYCTSEKVGENVLSYDPIPGNYEGCIPLSDVGNAWSL